MTLLFREPAAVSISQAIPSRTSSSVVGSVQVTPQSALQVSAVWAALRVRANMTAAAGIDTWIRRPGGGVDSFTTPPVLATPDGRPLQKWLWATQFDLDRYGNCFGLISARDGFGLPARIDLWDQSMVKVLTTGTTITGYRYNGVRYDPSNVWHETQYQPAGFPMGLSPLANAAWSIGGYLSAQQFALQWFGAGAQPAGVLKNTEEDRLPVKTREEAKRRFRESTGNGDIFVVGADWEWTPSTVTSATAAFLDEMNYGVGDIARWFDVPGDLIDAQSPSGSITYANQAQRMTQLLVTSLEPTWDMRAATISQGILPAAQYCTFDTKRLLMLDPETQSKVINGQILARRLAPSEARATDQLAPFTPAQIAEFDTLAVPLAKPKTGDASE